MLASAETGLVFKVVREERGFDVLAEFVADGFAKVERAEMAGGLPPAAMTPGTKDHEDAVSWVGRLVVGLEGGVFGLRPPEVFLIPPAADFERGNGDGGEVVLDGAESPEVVVGGVVEEGLARWEGVRILVCSLWFWRSGRWGCRTSHWVHLMAAAKEPNLRRVVYSSGSPRVESLPASTPRT